MRLISTPGQRNAAGNKPWRLFHGHQPIPSYLTRQDPSSSHIQQSSHAPAADLTCPATSVSYGVSRVCPSKGQRKRLSTRSAPRPLAISRAFVSYKHATAFQDGEHHEETRT